MSHATLVLVSVLSVATSGCLTGVYSARMGRPYPARSLDCALRFDYFDAQSELQLLAEYLPVGDLEIYHLPDEFTWAPKYQDKLRPEACRLGGELVAFRTLDWTGGWLVNALGHFTVYRRKGSIE